MGNKQNKHIELFTGVISRSIQTNQLIIADEQNNKAFKINYDDYKQLLDRLLRAEQHINIILLEMNEKENNRIKAQIEGLTSL